MSNPYEYQKQIDMFGGQHRTRSTKTMAENLYDLLDKYPELKGAKKETVIWRYLQEFEGVDDAIRPEQFLDEDFPSFDSIRRRLDDVEKTLHLNQ